LAWAEKFMVYELTEALQTRTVSELRRAIQANPAAAKHPKAIMEAAGAAFLPAVELLYRNGADLNTLWRNYRPLHALMQTDPHEAGGKPSAERIACLEWLLDHGADPEQHAAWPSARALIIAAFSGVPEYVALLRNKGACIDGFTGAALGDLKAVKKALREQSGFVHKRDGGRLSALQCAAGSRLTCGPILKIAELLIESGADVQAQTRSWGHDVNAAYFAARKGGDPMFELLLQNGADPTDALGHAVWGGHYELAELALSYGGNLDRARANGKPLLNDLIRWGQIPQAMWMLEHGAGTNEPDEEKGWTAVHQAASRGNALLMKAVLEAGGDFRRPDKQGRTAIGIARKQNRTKLVDLMLG
jgi:ankyrin repeat protein